MIVNKIPIRKDLRGEIFGEWEALIPSRKEGNLTYWLCRCSCGTEKEVVASSLIRGLSKSCGCLRKAPDLRGNHFGLWTVIEKSTLKSATNEHIYWVVKCECGELKDVAQASLLSGQSSSCGCRGIIGKQFVYLTVLSYAYTKGSTYWNCICVCGTTLTCRRSTLVTGGITSCGCRKNKSLVVDISGNTYNRLTALYPWSEDTPHRWLFVCDCGSTLITQKNSVVQGKTQSCGCLNIELSTKRLSDYILSGKHSGPNNPLWKGGLSSLNKQIRENSLYRLWRNSVISRDNSTCVTCESTDNIHVHHKKQLVDIIDSYNIKTIEEAKSCALLWDIDNGITLCESCHAKEHLDIKLFNRFVSDNVNNWSQFA